MQKSSIHPLLLMWWCFLIVLFGTSATFSSAVEDWYFKRSPKDVAVTVGSSVTLPCEVTPNFGVVYYWELNGSKIVNTTRRFMRDSDLHITRVDRERDTGEFTCIAQDLSRKNEQILSSAASLLIQFIEEPEVILHSPQKPEMIENGSEVSLKCHLEASGDVHFEWFKNSELIFDKENLELKKNHLTIKNVNPNYNGIYKCMAKNEAGTLESVKNFPLIVKGKDVPLIKTIPNDLIVKEDSTAYFHCNYQNVDKTEWYFKRNELLKSSNRIIIHPNGTLQINNVQSGDEGVYDCCGMKNESNKSVQMYSAQLQLAYIDQFTETSFEPVLSADGKKIIGEGSLFQLTCLEPKSLPFAKKWWQNPLGHTISDRGDAYVDDGRLIINKVKQTDAGKYTCYAENIAGQTRKSIELIVTSKPEILKSPQSITVDENDNSILNCLYNTTHPEYTIVKWRKDGKFFKHEYDETSSSHQRIRAYKHNGTLIIHSTQTTDRGEYVCEVITGGFEPVVSDAATISVIEQLRFVPPPMNKKLELDSVTKIHCKAQGTPPPIIHWEKNGIQSENFPSHITDMNGTLHFNRVTANDKGQYNCIATNSQGTINSTINIEVVVAPRFIVPPLSPVEVNEGDSISIDCIVEGDPEPTIQWDKNLKMNGFDLTRFKTLPNGTLHILEVYRDDENKYGCTAGNSAGLNRKEVQLIVHSKDSYHNNNLDGDTTVTKAVLITMSVAGAYIILVIGLMVWCRYRRKSRKIPIADGRIENGELEHQELKTNLENGVAQTVVSKTPLNGTDIHKEGQKSDGAETCNSQGSNQSKKSKNNYEKLALSRTLLKDLTLIGRGEFGDIKIAKISRNAIMGLENNPDKRPSSSSSSSNAENKKADETESSSALINEDKEKDYSVLVKILMQTKEENSLSEFKREIDMFSKLSHENITKLIGLCREQEPHYMVMEHTDWGDLKKFLVATKSGTPLTNAQNLAVIHQVCRGMEHIANNRMLHKDLAARNCIVNSNLMVKIGMLRLTRDPYSQEYCKHANQIIPLRWSPYEAVYEDEYSTKSDVYSFGVVIWEVYSQGELPHSKINDTSFLAKLKEKKLEWKSHPSTGETLQKLQELCWDVNPQNRPSFTQLTKDIGDLLKSS